jgi:hypothetical protein
VNNACTKSGTDLVPLEVSVAQQGMVELASQGGTAGFSGEAKGEVLEVEQNRAGKGHAASNPENLQQALRAPLGQHLVENRCDHQRNEGNSRDGGENRDDAP